MQRASEACKLAMAFHAISSLAAISLGGVEGIALTSKSTIHVRNSCTMALTFVKSSSTWRSASYSYVVTLAMTFITSVFS